MASPDVSFEQFAAAVDLFTRLLDSNSKRPAKSISRYFPDPPGGQFATTYCEQMATRLPGTERAILRWEIPVTAVQQSDTQLLRALLTQSGQEIEARKDSYSLIRQLETLFAESRIQLVIITGWTNLLTAKRKSVSLRPAILIARLIRAELSPTCYLAIGDPTILEQVFTSVEPLANEFHPLIIPKDKTTEQESDTSSDITAHRLLSSVFIDQYLPPTEPDNEDIDRLVREAHGFVHSDQYTEAEDLLRQAEALAKDQGAYIWFAFIEFARGEICDQAADPLGAIPHFEHALQLFEEYEIAAMAGDASVFLGNMLAKTDQHDRALEVLQHALETIATSRAINSSEGAHLRHSLYKEIGTSYHIHQDWDRAIEAYEMALHVDPPVLNSAEKHDVHVHIMDTLLVSGQMGKAISLGESLLRENQSTSEPEDWSFIGHIQFDLGIAYQYSDQREQSLAANDQALTYFQQLRKLPVHQRGFAFDPAMQGRLFVNLGSAHPYSVFQFPRMLGYWRCGLAILQKYEAYDTNVPLACMEQLQSSLPDQDYQNILELSETTYQGLRVLSEEFAPEATWRPPLERAVEIAEWALDLSGSQSIALARKALDLSPNCADAYTILAMAADNPDEKFNLLETAVRAGEGTIIFKEHFTASAGHFWSIPITRPYLRAQYALAIHLWTQEEQKAAVEHASEVLRLDAQDHLEVRYTLANWYMTINENRNLDRLLKRFPNDNSTAWTYTRALHAFRRAYNLSLPDGLEIADQLLSQAIKRNPYVIAFLLKDTALSEEKYVQLNELLDTVPRKDEIAKQREAAWYTEAAADVWDKSGPALGWLILTVENLGGKFSHHT